MNEINKNDEERNLIARKHLKEEFDNFERIRNSYKVNCQIRKLKWRLQNNRYLVDDRKNTEKLHNTFLSFITGGLI